MAAPPLRDNTTHLVGHGLNVLLLGPESSGKTSLVLQLRALAQHSSILSSPSSISTSPTTGQEVDVLELHDLYAGAVQRSSSGTNAKETLTRKQQQQQGTRTESSEVRAAHQEDCRHVVVREVGGRMMSVWPKFLTNATTSSGGLSAIVFVVDVSLPAGSLQLSSACVEFHQLLCGSNTYPVISTASGTRLPVLLLFNKVCSPATLPVEFARQLFLMKVDDSCLSEKHVTVREHGGDNSGSNVTVMVADTWTGLGLVDVFEWLRHIGE